MEDVDMAETPSDPQCQLRRRTIDGGSTNLPLNLEVGYRVSDGNSIDRGTPSPCGVKFINDIDPKSSGSTLMEFRKKQQSFELQTEDCDEEEIIIDSDEEATEGGTALSRPESPMEPLPIQDFGVGNVNYKEGPQVSDFLKAYHKDTECITDVSDAESDNDLVEESNPRRGKAANK